MEINKGFINIIVLGLVAILGLAGSVYVADRLNEYEKAQEEQKLGATILTTDLSNTLNTLRTNVNTSLTNLNAQLTDSTSSDPGHIHTTSSVNGFGSTTPISRGGTGTSTAPTDNKLLIGSSTSYAFTNAIPDCASASSSKLLFTSSTRSWSCGLDTASIATSTIAGLILRASSTSPYVEWTGQAFFRKASTSVDTTSANAEFIMATSTIPANLVGANKGLRVKAGWTLNSNDGVTLSYNVKYGNQVVASTSAPTDYGFTTAETTIFGTDATTQVNITSVLGDDKGVNSEVDIGATITNTTSTSAQNLTVSFLTQGATMSGQGKVYYITIEPL